MEKSKSSDDGRGRSPFGERLFLARRRKGLTQRQVSEEIGISASNLAELEQTGAGSAFTVALALLYGVNPVWLALDRGPMTGSLPAPEWLEALTPEELEITRRFVEGLVAARQTSRLHGTPKAARTKRAADGSNDDPN
ncbi:helix-turn-helix domain-containing protein [Trinickia sp. NRRL B-1857]|uniref:helix-turn-helix domain-containing protein n=1 Tax=Trinickia sp. NRRL B-1857 TaxID=3162879 RepID=UPI003D273652